MSMAHSGVSFNHSCLKVPVDPRSQRPAPNYERLSPHKVIESNEANDEYQPHFAREKREPVSPSSSSLGTNLKSVESYLQFYENIPDYSDLHHLSDDEFYSRLKSLKIAQKRFCGSEIDGNDEDTSFAPRSHVDTSFAARERPSSYSSFSSRDKFNSRTKYRKPKMPPTYKKEPEPEHFPASNSSSLYSPPSKNQRVPNEDSSKDNVRSSILHSSLYSPPRKSRNILNVEDSSKDNMPSSILHSSSFYSPSSKNRTVPNVEDFSKVDHMRTSLLHSSSLYSPSKNRTVPNMEESSKDNPRGSILHSSLYSPPGKNRTIPNEELSKMDHFRSSVLHSSVNIKPPPPKINIVSDCENISDIGYDEKNTTEENSEKADRESSMLNIWDKTSVNEFMSKEDEMDEGSLSEDGLADFGGKSRSLPSSPGCKSKMCSCDTPQICQRLLQMSLRDKEDQNVDPMQYHVHGIHGDHCIKEHGHSGKKKKKSHSRPVPLLSRIPLFDKIMAEQEARRRLIHYRYAKELQALVQPFSFTKREEEERQRIRSSCSNPDLSSSSRPHTPFKAKPVPRNLFSNYAYERMREDEFYRALKKRIRAEEMLKSSSLPPSMAARERKFRSKSLDFLDYKSSKKKRHKSRGYKRACEVLRREMQTNEYNKNTNSPKRRSRSAWLPSHRSRRRSSITDSSTEVSPYESISEPERRSKTRPHSALSINRNNLASVLRIETVRKRMEKEMEENLEESRVKEEARFKARLVRMTPAWRALNYSTDEDLAMRVATRREEERLRREHHQKLMGTIYGRVHQMPPLFQRQTSPIRPKYSGNIKKRSHDEKECKKNGLVYDDMYYDNDDGNPKERSKADEEETEKKSKRFSVSDPTSPRRKEFRSHESCESVASQDKSEGSKLDESDDDTVSHEDDMEDFADGHPDPEVS